jgi:DNA-binding CsgD family transcriptional regulator
VARNGQLRNPDKRRSPHRVAMDDKRGKPQRGLPPTNRQLEVLLLLIDHSEQDAADSLGVSVYTIKGHIANLYARVGAYNRAHAVWLCYGLLKARQHGIERRSGRDRRIG